MCFYGIAVCGSWRLEDSRPQPHAGECAGDALFLALARTPFVSLGGWKKGRFVSFGGWKTATFLVSSDGDVRQWGPLPAGCRALLFRCGGRSDCEPWWLEESYYY